MSHFITNQIKQWSKDENPAEEQSKREFFNDLLTKTGRADFPKKKIDALALYNASKQNSSNTSLLRAVVGVSEENGKEETLPTTVSTIKAAKISHTIHKQMKSWSKDKDTEEHMKKMKFFTALLSKVGVAAFPRYKADGLALYEESKVGDISSSLQQMTLEAAQKPPSSVAHKILAHVPHYMNNQVKQWSIDKDPTEQQRKIDFFTNLLTTGGAENFPKTKLEGLALYSGTVSVTRKQELDAAYEAKRYQALTNDIPAKIGNWAKDEDEVEQQNKTNFFHDYLAKNGFEKFPRNQADALVLYEESKLAKAGTSLLRAAMHVPDAPLTTSTAAAFPQTSAATVIASAAAANEKSSGKAPTTAEELERRQRRNGEPISFPTLRWSPIKVYCGGGKHCGYQVPYTPGEPLPAYCDGHAEKQATATNSRRVNHQCNWVDIVCVHNRCEISSTHLISALTYGCCPNCRLELHGGVITHFGLVLH